MNLKLICILTCLLIVSCGYYPEVVFETNYGSFTMQLDGKNAPKHTENFIKLVEQRFYVGTTFHRVVKNALVQGGDPLSKDMDRRNDGTGGPGYTIDAEIGLLHKQWAVAAARQGDQVNPLKKSSGSQFYICLKDLPMLDNGYSVFGKVTDGFEVIEKISKVRTDANENPLTKVLIQNVYKK